MVMGKNAAEGNRKKGKIAEEIRKRIGRSVLIAYIVVEVIIVIIMGQTVYYNKKAQLTLESESAANRLAGFLKNTRERHRHWRLIRRFNRFYRRQRREIIF